MENFSPQPIIPPSHSIDAWRVLRILSEFVEGFESMVSLGPSVAIFGSAIIKSEDPYYKLAQELTRKIVAKGFGVITGGGPGIMEACNEAAIKAKGLSCGLCIDLPFEEAPNAFISDRYLLRFRYFFVRKVMFVRYAQAFIVLPGAYGTLDELFEALTLISTKKIKKFPVYLVGKSYWSGLLEWIEKTIVAYGNLTKEDFLLMKLTDDLDEVVNGIEEHARKSATLENF